MTTDTLHTLVSGAIWRAQQLEDLGIGTAALAWAEVSALEEALAKALPETQPEGRIARRGAVRAALNAGDPARAHELARHYGGEVDACDALRGAFQEMLEADARRLTSRYRYAAKRHAWHDARELAQRIRTAGAFGLAA